MSGWMVLLPCLALVLLSFVRAGTGRSLALVLGIVAIVFAAFLGGRMFVPDENLWPGSEVARRTRWLAKHLRKSKGWEGRPVVILTGSSATYYGVDALQLEAELLKLGKPATVLSFCMPGDNHHERIYMLETFLRMIGSGKRERLAKADVFYFGEAFDDYDRNPLNRFDKEAYSERAIVFLNPKKAVQVWQAYTKLVDQEPDRPVLEPLTQLAEHALLNAFAVGSLSEWDWWKTHWKKTPPFFPLEGGKDHFNYEAAEQATRRVQAKHRLDSYPSDLYPQWYVVSQHVRELMTPYVDQFGAYCLPTLEPHRLRYAYWFRSRAPKKYLVVGPPAAEDLEGMLQADYWFDGVHPTGVGAQAVTTWLAAEIAQHLPSPPPEVSTHD